MDQSAQEDADGVSFEALSIIYMLLSEDHNDVICMLNHLSELCFQGKRGWDPISATERELEENSVFTEESIPVARTNARQGRGRRSSAIGILEVTNSVSAQSGSENEGSNSHSSGCSESEDEQGKLYSASQSRIARAPNRRIVARALRSEGGDAKAIQNLQAFFASHEKNGVTLQTSNDTIVLLVHRACIVSAFMDMLEEMLAEYHSLENQESNYELFLEAHLWMLRKLCLILKLCSRVKSLKPFLASPELGLYPLLATFINTFTHDLDEDVTGDLLAVMENLARLVSLAPAMITTIEKTGKRMTSPEDRSHYFELKDGQCILLALLRVCYDHITYESDVQTKAFSTLMHLAERSKENAEWLVFNYKYLEDARLQRELINERMSGFAGSGIKNESKSATRHGSERVATNTYEAIGIRAHSMRERLNFSRTKRIATFRSTAVRKRTYVQRNRSDLVSSPGSARMSAVLVPGTDPSSPARTIKKAPDQGDTALSPADLLATKRNNKEENKYMGHANTLQSISGVLNSFIEGRLTRAQKINLLFSIDIMNAIISHKDDNVCVGVYESPILMPLLAIIDYNHELEGSKAGIAMLAKLIASSQAVQKLFLDTYEQMNLVPILVRHLEGCKSTQSQKHVLTLLLSLAKPPNSHCPLQEERTKFLLFLSNSERGLMKNMKSIIAAYCDGGYAGYGENGDSKYTHVNAASCDLVTNCLRVFTWLIRARLDAAVIKLAEKEKLFKENGIESPPQSPGTSPLLAAGNYARKSMFFKGKGGAPLLGGIREVNNKTSSPAAAADSPLCGKKSTAQDIADMLKLDDFRQPLVYILNSEDPDELGLLDVIEKVLHHPAFLDRTSLSIFDSMESYYDHDVDGISSKNNHAKATKTLAGVTISIRADNAGVLPVDRKQPADLVRLPETVVQALALVVILAKDTVYKNSIRLLWNWTHMPVILSYLRINTLELKDANSTEARAEQCIIMLLTVLLTTYYDGKITTYPFLTSNVRLDKVSELADMHCIILRDCKKLQLEYQIAKKLTRAHLPAQVLKSYGKVMAEEKLPPHKFHTKLTLCLLILSGGNPYLPQDNDGERVLVRHLNSKKRSQYSSVVNVFDALLPESNTDQDSDTDHANVVLTEQELYGNELRAMADLLESDCYQLLSSMLSDWYHAEVAYHLSGNEENEPYSGVAVYPRELNFFEDNTMGLQSPFGITIMSDNKSSRHSKQALKRLFHGGARSRTRSSSPTEDNSDESEHSDEGDAADEDGEHLSSNRKKSKKEKHHQSTSSIYSDINCVELENLGLDIPLEGLLFGFKELALGAAIEGVPGGYFPEFPADPCTSQENRAAAGHLPVSPTHPPYIKFNGTTSFSYNAAQQFLCTPRMISLLVNILCECHLRSGYKIIESTYFSAGKKKKERASESKDDSRGFGMHSTNAHSHESQHPDFDSFGRRRRAVPIHHHRSHRPSVMLPSSDPNVEKPFSIVEQTYYRRCMSLCVQILLQLSFLYTHAAPERIMLDWFPTASHVTKGYIRLLGVLTKITNTNKILSILFEKKKILTAEPNHVSDDPNEIAFNNFGYNIDQSNYISRICKALYRVLREAKSDSSYENDHSLFRTSTLATMSLDSSVHKLHESGSVEPKYRPVRIPGRDTPGGQVIKRRHAVCSFYSHGYHGRDARSSTSAGYAPVMLDLAQKFGKGLAAEVWTYHNGSPYAASVPISEAEFYTDFNNSDHSDGEKDEIVAADKCTTSKLQHINVNVNDSSSMNRDAVLDAMDTAEYIIIGISKEYRDCPLCRLEFYHAVQLARANQTRLLLIILDSTYAPVNFKTKNSRDQEWKLRLELDRIKQTKKYVTEAPGDIIGIIKTAGDKKLSGARRQSAFIKKKFLQVAAAAVLIDEKQRLDEEEKEGKKRRLHEWEEVWQFRGYQNPNIPPTIASGVDGWLKRAMGSHLWFACWDLGANGHHLNITSWVEVCYRCSFNNAHFIIPEIAFREV